MVPTWQTGVAGGANNTLRSYFTTTASSSNYVVDEPDIGSDVTARTRALPKCGRCGKRTVAFEYQRCQVCEGRGRK